MAVSAVAIYFGLGFINALMIDGAMEVGEQRYPLAVTQGERLRTAPRLQQAPPAELREFRSDEESLLEGYGWLNKDAGSVHIPIADAMRLTIEEGLPSRTPEDRQLVAAPGTMPSDGSAGRMPERKTR